MEEISSLREMECSNCALPHNPDNYGYITGKYQEIMEIVKQNADLKEEK